MGRNAPKIAVIVNPQSANGDTGKRWPQIEPAIRRVIGPFRPFVTERPGHGVELTQQALKEGYDRIVSVGGDGTHHEVLNGFFEGYLPINPAASLAIVPQGTGSDLARLLGLSRESDAIPLIAGDNTLRADVGRVTFTLPQGGTDVRYFINIADFGAGGVVAERVNRHSKVLGGFASFLWALIKTLFTYSGSQMRLQIDGLVLEQRCMDVILANGQYFGGGIHVAPDARLDNGTFEVFVIGQLTLLEAIQNLRAFYNGDFKKIKNLVKSFRASRVVAQSNDCVLVNLDGELPGQLPAAFEILPSALNLVVGEAAFRASSRDYPVEGAPVRRRASSPGYGLWDAAAETAVAEPVPAQTAVVAAENAVAENAAAENAVAEPETAAPKPPASDLSDLSDSSDTAKKPGASAVRTGAFAFEPVGIRYAVIANPHSANDRTGRRWPVLERSLKKVIGDFSPIMTERPGHATELARHALKEGYDRIVCVGGDGTLQEIVSGFFDGSQLINPSATLAVLPEGTASDFTRTLGIHRETDALAILASNRTRAVDVGRVTYALARGGRGLGYFVNCAHVGAGSTVAERFNRYTRAFGGAVSFVRGIVATAMTYRNTAIALEIDGHQFEERCHTLIVAGGRYAGDGMLVAPEAQLGSGVFEVYVIGDVGRFEAIANIPKLYRGRLNKKPDVVTYFKARRITARSSEQVPLSLEGEQTGLLPITIDILPSVLHVVAAEDPPNA